ncbi:hypothetical protein BD413DRAFT_147774 [Trametes elegans]|nr:hypothetical protein BD413DRAFT_147774 [Trametes elegans]
MHSVAVKRGDRLQRQGVCSSGTLHGSSSSSLYLACLIGPCGESRGVGKGMATLTPQRCAVSSHTALTFTTMSTRSAARPRQPSRPTEHQPHAQDQGSAAHDEKENGKVNGSSGRSRVTRKSSKTYCVCKKPDDGSPMIHCAGCKDWCVPRLEEACAVC